MTSGTRCESIEGRLSPNASGELAPSTREAASTEGPPIPTGTIVEQATDAITSAGDPHGGSPRSEVSPSRQALMQELLTAQERERERIARELHDQMGQHIVALALGVAKLARLTAECEPAQPVLAQLREITDLLGRDVHTLAFRLRPAALDHLGLAVALASYGDHMSAHSGVEVDVHCDDLTDLDLSGSLQTGLYRIAQEAITNAVKHAHARRVSLILERRRDALLLIVEDDGKGLRRPRPDASGAGFGLTGVNERASLLGGQLSIESTPGHGTTLFVCIPLGDHEHSTSSPAR